MSRSDRESRHQRITLVTGAAGTLGRALTRRLRAPGGPGDLVAGMDIGEKPPGSATDSWIGSNFAGPYPETVLDTMGSVTHLVHLAARVTDSPEPPGGSWVAGYDGEVGGVVRLLAALPELRHVVFASSYMVYDQSGGACDQSRHTTPAALSPGNYYAWTKCTVECLLADIAPRSSSLRLMGVYGPGVPLSAGRTIMRVVEAGVNESDLVLSGDGQARRNHLFIDDAVEALFRATVEEWDGTVDVAGADAPSIRELVDRVQEECSGWPRVSWTDPARHVPSFVVNPAPALDAFGYSARVGIAEGIRRYVAWVRGPATPG